MWRQLIKFLCVASCITGFLSTSTLLSLCVRQRWRRTHLLTRLVAFWSRLILFIVGVKVTTKGLKKSKENFLVVSNHQSYLDVLIQATCFPTCYVTSQEIKETPGLGHICRMAGCLFVDRRTRSQLHKEIAELTEALNHGLNVTIYPEATSTNGDTVIRFRRPLYIGAIDSKCRVKPAVLRYESIDEQPVNTQNRDTVCWYGDMGFFGHIWNLMACHKIHVNVQYLEPVNSKGKDAAELTEITYDQINSKYQPYPTLEDTIPDLEHTPQFPLEPSAN